MKFHCCLLIAFVMLSQAASAAEPARGPAVLYNCVADAGAEGENIFQQTYGGRYSIVPARKVAGLIPAKVVRETYPLYGRVPGGPGKVAVAFIVLPNGHVKDPVVFYSTQPRNDRMVREMVSKWLWEPAKLNGAPVPSIMSYYVGFSQAERRVGYPHPTPKPKK